MERCINEVEYFIDTGIDYKPVLTKCGYTNPYGRIAICDDCENDKEKMRSIRNHEANVKADNDWLASAGYGEIWEILNEVGLATTKKNYLLG